MLPSERQKEKQCHIQNICGRTCETSNKLRVPKYNSTLRQQRCLDVLLNPKSFQTKVNSKDLETFNSGVKITKKLNFCYSNTVYKNLIPINVNDSTLLPEKALGIGRKEIIRIDKTPEPDLRDFLKPVQPLTNTIAEPEIEVECFQKEIDILSYYNKFIT